MPSTPATFDRDATAEDHARRHLDIDEGLREAFYLPAEAPEREIRLVDINDQLPERAFASLEPLDFGVGGEDGEPYTLLVLDVTSFQWERIQRGELPLPPGWSLTDAVRFSR